MLTFHTRQKQKATGLSIVEKAFENRVCVAGPCLDPEARLPVKERTARSDAVSKQSRQETWLHVPRVQLKA